MVKAPYVDYKLDVKKGVNEIRVQCLPNFSINQEMNLRYAIALEDQTPTYVDLSKQAETREWEKTSDQLLCRGLNPL